MLFSELVDKGVFSGIFGLELFDTGVPFLEIFSSQLFNAGVLLVIFSSELLDAGVFGSIFDLELFDAGVFGGIIGFDIFDYTRHIPRNNI
ncbi:hypothetical protein DTO027B6_2204 [Paecilomyces variotii]|nr:hypothetical protein DTO027B6_2204 [Paecilomyces variotii]KAJ9352994.1 hypothetical protein DTO027B9_5499 [Paecilomyces variotii]KAJ9390203.1 hypothetical protein DTO032I4_1729 [Paecilomyces variotii]